MSNHFMLRNIHLTKTTIVLLVVAQSLLAGCSSIVTQVQTTAEGDSFPPDGNVQNDFQNNKSKNTNGILKILTLNVAHGRKDAVNQMFVKTETIQKNLKDIANVLKKENADVVALQEADGPSGWSGSFDHVESIAQLAGYPWHYRADHARTWLFSYGTAVLSRWPISETIEHTFAPSPPTLNKGFLLSHMAWQPDVNTEKQLKIDIVSVHLDFSRQKVRQTQITEMAEVLSTREHPMIILGDFNSEWFSDASVVKRLADQAKLKVYEPNAENLRTYVSRDRRFDWILISDELEFVSYKVLPEIISDHLAVVAEVKLSKP
ncbi:endonuclease/exonuclease/phosphatase family protein [Kaarinaea lacus]